MCLITCWLKATRVSDRSWNGSSLTASERALASEVFKPLIDVQYLTSASKMSDLELSPLVAVAAGVAASDCFAGRVVADVGVVVAPGAKDEDCEHEPNGAID